MEAPQNLYAKNLQQSFGYPLRFPEPKPGLPSSYAQSGLQIGDVGYVDDDGMFEVMLNICFSSDHELHCTSKDIAGFVGLTKFNPNEDPPIPNAFPSGRIISHGIQGSHGDILIHTQSAPCIFMSRSTSGALLILPSGAVRQNLSKNKEEEFRKLAEKHALDWCRFTHCKSLYLITGLYKTSSWYLASFHDARPNEKILERDNTGRYIWDSRCDYRQSPKENRDENQTVLISGFKIEVRWGKHTVIDKLAPRSRSILSELLLLASFLTGIFSELIFLANFLLGGLVSVWQQMVSRSALKMRGHGTLKNMDGGVRVDRVPALSQPFHPSDVINHWLLDKNPNIQVAVTHDSQWLIMLEENELPHEDMMEEGRFRAFLEEKYTDDSNSDNVVYLRRKIEEPNGADFSESHKSALSPKTFFHPAPSGDVRQIVITRMRAENTVTGLGRIPVGFYVLTQFDGTKRKSEIKSVLLHNNIIEWDDEIILPMDPTVKVRFSINASFEFGPTLGNGETLCTSEITVGDLAQCGSTYLSFSSAGGKDASCRSSLLITLEERRFDAFADLSKGDPNLEYEDHSYIGVAEETDKGHEALLRYHTEHEIVGLKESVERFKNALDLCSSNHQCRAAALFNLATAKFIHCQVYGTISDIDEAIAFYREVAVLRPAPLPDRPVTLLQLAHALLHRYGRLKRDASAAEEIGVLVTEVKQICCEGSYEHRAADLALQTLKRYQAMTSETFVEFDRLISDLDRSARIPPDWYFDRPYRLINFSAALRMRFERTGDLDYLEKSISVIKEAALLLPDGHFDKPWVLASLGDALYARFVKCGDVADLDSSISMIEDALKFTPVGHVEKPYMLTRLGVVLLIRFISRNAPDLGRLIFTSGSTVYLTPKARLDHLDNLARSTATCDFSDLGQAISRHRDAMELLPDDNPHRSGCLTNLAGSLFTRFWCSGDSNDLEEAVSRYKDAVKLTLNGRPDKPDCLNNLALSLRARFEHFDELSDLEEAISRYKDAIELAPDSYPCKPHCLGGLGNCFATRFERLGELNDLEEAISRYKDVVKLTPHGHPDKLGCLGSPSRCFVIRFERFAELSHLEKVISKHKKAVKLTPNGYSGKLSRHNAIKIR